MIEYKSNTLGVTYTRNDGSEILAYCASASAAGCKEAAPGDLRYFSDRVCVKDSILGMPCLRKVPISVIVENIPGSWIKVTGKVYYGSLLG